MSDPIKDFLQPISSWMFDNDKRIFESYDNVFLLVGIVVALVGSTAFLYKNYCEKNNLPVPLFIKILSFLFGSGRKGGGG
jgi:hypothetical protein